MPKPSDPHYHAWVKSLDAHGATQGIDKRYMFSPFRHGRSEEAVSHAYHGRHKEAADIHDNAAAFHTKKASEVGTGRARHPYSNKPIGQRNAKLHRDAATAHKEAADMHRSLIKKPEADTPPENSSQHMELEGPNHITAQYAEALFTNNPVIKK